MTLVTCTDPGGPQNRHIWFPTTRRWTRRHLITLQTRDSAPRAVFQAPTESRGSSGALGGAATQIRTAERAAPDGSTVINGK